jgi:hypothetical protein
MEESTPKRERYSAKTGFVPSGHGPFEVTSAQGVCPVRCKKCPLGWYRKRKKRENRIFLVDLTEGADIE